MDGDFNHQNQDIMMQPPISGCKGHIAGGLGFWNRLDLIAISVPMGLNSDRIVISLVNGIVYPI